MRQTLAALLFWTTLAGLAGTKARADVITPRPAAAARTAAPDAAPLTQTERAWFAARPDAVRVVGATEDERTLMIIIAVTLAIILIIVIAAAV